MNNQELFDKVATHLLVQYERAVQADDSTICAYRGNGNLRCAAGALINDEHYSSELENHDAMFFRVKLALLKSGVEEHQIELVRQLQTVHDNILPENWLQELARLAASENLSSERLKLVALRLMSWSA